MGNIGPLRGGGWERRDIEGFKSMKKGGGSNLDRATKRGSILEKKGRKFAEGNLSHIVSQDELREPERGDPFLSGEEGLCPEKGGLHGKKGRPG